MDVDDLTYFIAVGAAWYFAWRYFEECERSEQLSRRLAEARVAEPVKSWEEVQAENEERFATLLAGKIAEALR